MRNSRVLPRNRYALWTFIDTHIREGDIRARVRIIVPDKGQVGHIPRDNRANRKYKGYGTGACGIQIVDRGEVLNRLTPAEFDTRG